MKFIKIPKKKKGEYREICIPSSDEKVKFRIHLSDLNNKALKICNKESVHGFMNGKSPVTNAKKHIGFVYTLKFDLSDFFDTVKPSHLRGKISEAQISALMPDGRAYQGLPTSPVIANIAAIDMDAAILRKIKDEAIVYTRYSDDMCFSFNDFDLSKKLNQWIPQIVGRCGFRINKNKTWLQDSRFGNRIITGVSVTQDSIKPTRTAKRKLRAAIHQKNKRSVMGLTEWSKLKEPSTEPKSNITQDALNELCKLWDINRIKIHDIPKKQSEIISDNCIISGDPIQILGLSNWTTNWKSCMKHPTGQYHRHAAFWVYYPNTRIAGLLSGQQSTEASFTRPTFSARALIHQDANGKKYYDRVYGDSASNQAELKRQLNSAGIVDIYYGKSAKFDGYVKKSLCHSTPYMDNMLYKHGIDTAGKVVYTLYK
jgi:RNA-directed DNA polymerase